MVPLFWTRGSVIATAVTPIIVAIVSEALRKPADVITSATPKVTRRSATGAAVRSEQPTGVGARGKGPEQASRWGTEDDPFGLRQPPPRKRRRFPWRLTIITGLLAAVIGAGVVTASELAIFGHQVGNPKRETGLLGGSSSQSSSDEEETPTPTPTATETPAEDEAATPTETATPEETDDRDPDAVGHGEPERDATNGAAHPHRPAHRGHAGPRPRSRGQRPDPDGAHLADRPRLEPRRGPGRAPPRHARDEPRRAPSRAAPPRSSAATSRPPSRS